MPKVSTENLGNTLFVLGFPYLYLKTPNMKRFNFAIIEDSGLWRLLISNELNKAREFHITLTCEWGECFLDTYKKHRIDFIMLDINLPGESGIVLSKRIQSECPDIPIIVLTSSSNHSDISYFHSIGVVAYIHKSNINNLCQILRRITGLDKNTYRFEPLQQTEIQLIHLVCQRYKNNEIADIINKSEKTVEKNLRNLCEKVDIDNSKLAIFEFAVKHGYWNVHANM